jgi:hypothetical protein
MSTFTPGPGTKFLPYTGTSPSFTDVTVMDDLTLSAGTANGVLFLNGSKVVSSGSALTFDGTNLGIGTSSPAGKLDNRGVSHLGSDSNNSLYVESTSTLVTIGAAGRSSFSTSALRFLTSDGTAALERMRLTSSGNLAIGLTSTSYKLDVRLAQYGFANFESITAGYSGIRLADPNQPIIEMIAGASSFQIVGGTNVSIRNYSAGSLRLFTSNLERAYVPAAGGMVVGIAAIATAATDGFLYVPTCAGTPTGTPTTQTGTAPIVIDTTNHKLYFYSGGTWRDAGP